MKDTEKVPKDKRGRHNNRPWKISKEKEECIMKHVGSFKGTGGHYGKEQSEKIYLPEVFNYQMF